MKNIYWILILFSLQSYSQNEQWYDYELDSNVRFKLPAENANLFDSEQDGINMYELSAELNEIVFAGNKFKVEDIILPKNLEDLKNLYDDVTQGVLMSYPNTILSKKDVKKNGFKGQKIVISDSIGNRLYESETYLLNNYIFLFNCISKDNTDIKNSVYFFNQITLSTDSKIKQLTGKSDFWKMILFFKTELLILLGIIGLIVAIIVIKKNYLQQRL